LLAVAGEERRRWFPPLAGHAANPFPGEPDKVCDTVAFVEDMLRGQFPWAIVIEFQIEPDALMFGRLMIYMGQLWLEIKPSEERGDRFSIGAVVVNLTGKGKTARKMEWPETGLVTHLGIEDRNLCEMSAKATLDAIAAGEVTLAVLPFIPLMQGGDDLGIIQQWLALGSAEPDARRRGDYGSLAVLFAEAAGRRPAWKQAITGWNMVVPQTVLEWQQSQRSKQRRTRCCKCSQRGSARFL